MEETTNLNTPQEDEQYDIYCKKCGTCGYIGCCGVKNFLEQHVKGKTNCLNEASIIGEILSHFEECNKENNI